MGGQWVGRLGLAVLVGAASALLHGTRYGWTRDVWHYAALWGGGMFLSQALLAALSGRRGDARLFVLLALALAGVVIQIVVLVIVLRAGGTHPLWWYATSILVAGVFGFNIWRYGRRLARSR